MAKKYHPDLYQSDGEKKWAESKMKEINEAYRILMDDSKRLQYDKSIDYINGQQPSTERPSSIDWEKVISLTVAVFNIIMVIPEGMTTFISAFCLMALFVACIWFSDGMGKYTGYRINTESPGCMVKIIAWILLFLPIIIMILSLIGVIGNGSEGSSDWRPY